MKMQSKLSVREAKATEACRLKSVARISQHFASLKSRACQAPVPDASWRPTDMKSPLISRLFAKFLLRSLNASTVSCEATLVSDQAVQAPIVQWRVFAKRGGLQRDSQDACKRFEASTIQASPALSHAAAQAECGGGDHLTLRQRHDFLTLVVLFHDLYDLCLHFS